MDYHFHNPHEKRTFTNKMADLYSKGIPGHTRIGLSADVIPLLEDTLGEWGFVTMLP
jgi:hypothetical protein